MTPAFIKADFMIKTTLVLTLAALISCAVPAVALADSKPYEPVTVTFDKTGADDPGLKTFVDSLRAAIDKADIAALKVAAAPNVLIYSPMIGFPDAAPPEAVGNPDKHPGAQRLDEAAILMTTGDMAFTREELDSMVIDLFGNALGPATIGHSKTARGALCSPAEPIFDRDKALAVADAAGVPAGNLWILSQDTEFHEKADAKSPVLLKLPAGTIVPFIEGSVDGEEGGEEWYSVALPSGKAGFASNDVSLGFQAVSICYGKVDEKWAVTSVIVPGL
jgi:hypothetical protein